MIQKLQQCIFVALITLFTSSASASYPMKLEFIGEATFPTGFMFDGTEVGGLSGIDYDRKNKSYIAICDDRAEIGFARFYDLKIDLSDGKLEDGDVTFTKVTEILDQDGSSFAASSVDPEAIRIGRYGKRLYWTSEGDANMGLPPFVRSMSRDGHPLKELETPSKYFPSADFGIRNNLAFESLTFGRYKKRLITATENALVQDGPAASLEAGSPARVLTLNAKTGKASKEYIYYTDAIPNPTNPPGAFATNGLVEMLTYKHDLLIAVERAFSVGVGNTIRLYLTTTRYATNVANEESIMGKKIRPMPKKLLLDLDELGITLDNIEGITFGPKIKGDQTLILVSDNNFNPNGQFTQFLAFRIRGPHYYGYKHYDHKRHW